MADIEVAAVRAAGGSSQQVGVPFTMEVDLINREFSRCVGPGSIDGPACCSGGHKSDLEVVLSGQTVDGESVNRTLKESTECVSLDALSANPRVVEISITIKKPGNYTIKATAKPIGDKGVVNSEQRSLTVKPRGTIGTPLPGGGGPGDDPSGNGGSGGDLVQTAINNPIATVGVLGASSIALRQIFGG